MIASDSAADRRNRRILRRPRTRRAKVISLYSLCLSSAFTSSSPVLRPPTATEFARPSSVCRSGTLSSVTYMVPVFRLSPRVWPDWVRAGSWNSNGGGEGRTALRGGEVGGEGE
ncbi:hypothetical protein U1Q18_009014 [Sarracenia purpurea var. burkii]